MYYIKRMGVLLSKLSNRDKKAKHLEQMLIFESYDQQPTASEHDPNRTFEDRTSDNIFVAIHKFKAKQPEDLSFSIGDHLEILDDTQVRFKV